MLRFELRGSDNNERIGMRRFGNVFLTCRKGAMTGGEMDRTSIAGSMAVQLSMLVYPGVSGQ